MTLKIPRWLRLTPEPTTVELHGFSDASLLAMIAVIYLRVLEASGEISVKLVCSKTRVAPLKRLTIPRLKLSAALILARFSCHVKRALNLTETPVILWTDSAVALTRISAYPSRWKDFVRNRVTAIQETIPTASWHFIQGKQNPADCASRGIKADQLKHHSLWWNGPSWFSQPSMAWPANDTSYPSKAKREERPGYILTSSQVIKQTYWQLLDRYSSLTRLTRITATCIHAIARFRNRQNITIEHSFTPNEFLRSIHFWVKEVQNSWFSYEIQTISQGKILPKSNSLTRLTPYIDELGMLRVGGRLQNSRIDADAKHPLILP